MRNGLVALILYCLIVAASWAEESAPLRLPSAKVALEPDDTLEFSLTAKGNPQHPPQVGAWLLPSGTEKPVANANPVARTFVSPSAKPGEWLVHVRGLKAERGTWDLFVRWSPAPTDPDAANGSRGEMRLNGAVSIKAEAADVVLLMDGSLSMGRTDPQRLRVGAAREFIEQSRRSGSVGRIAIVQFDSKSRTVATLTNVNENFEGFLEAIDERGETDIDGGIRHSLPLLSEAGAIVLLTDGKQEPGEYRNAHAEAKKAGIAIHTLALGRDADRTLLKRIAAETGGTYSDAVKDRDLALAYAAIASRIARVRPILTLESAQQPAAIPVDGACRSLAISMNGEQSGTLSVVGPRNENWTSPAQVAPSYFKDAPATGGWTATWNGPANPLAAAARTGLYPQFFRADFSGDGAVVIDTDEPALALSFADSGATLPAQRVETTLIFSDNTRQIIQLRDDGKNGDLRANDGVFAADLPPFPAGNGSYPESARGTVRVVVEGLRDGLPYRRESQSAFVFRRHLGAALIAGGSLDFGMRFNGDTARLEIPLRVRGPGGILTARMLPTENAELRNGTHNVELTSVPAQLASRQRSSAELALTIGQWQEPGLYGGIVEFELAGTGRARVPWTVRVQSPQLRVADRINVGLVTPGQSFELPLELSVDGGIARVESVELALPWRSRKLISLGVRSTNVVPGIDLSLRTPDKFPWRITATPSKQSLDFTVAEDAPGGALDARLILRDAARRELAVIALSGRIASHYMQAQLPLLLGPVEAGDRIGRTLRWTLAGPGALDARLPERSKLTLLPDPQFPALVPELNPAAPGDERGAKSRIRVATPAEAHAGEAGGWLQIECGPALIQRRWSAFVVQPHLGVEPSELDFGTMAPGQKRVLSTALTTHAVKPVPVAARVVRPIAKPNLPEIKIDDSSLGFALPPDERTTGTPLAMNVTLDLPDSTQDGTYTGSVEIASRLGHIALPVRVNVVSPVPVAPFHVSPAHILLRFPAPDAPPPTERLRIVSHRDTDQALVLRMQAEGEKTCANLLLDPESGLTTETMTLTLPARATLDVSVRAQPDARAGERSRVSIAGEGDEHIVSLLIERPQSHALVVTEEPSRLLNWLLLLLVLLLMLIAYLIRNLIKRPWLRYATYSILFHLAFLPLVMPKEKILEALPSSMQITLLETEASLGMELSEQQMRRLDALQAGAEPPPAVREQTLLADAPLPSQTVPEKKAADAPSKAELEKRAAEDLRAALEALPEPARKVTHDAADRPLDAEALRPPDAAPKLQQPAENAVAARTASTLAERFNDAPLPAAPQRPDLQPERSAADLPLATLSESTPTRPAPNSPSPQRPQERTPTLDEAPLQIETLPNEASIKPATKVAEATDRVRDVAAQVQSESGGSAGTALPSPTLPAANSGSSGAESSARSTQLPASKTGERVAAPVSGAGNSSAATTGRPAVTSGLGALDGGDAPLDSGPRAGSVAKPGSETGTGDRGGGEGPRTARGTNLTGDSSDRGSIQHLAAALERSAAVAGGKAAPRTGEGTFERRSSPGDERTSGVGNATADAGMRPARDLGTGLDGSPLSPGDLGKIAQAKPGGDPRGAPSTEPGRGAAVAIPGNLSSKGSLAGLPAAFGPPQLGTTARPGERNTPVLKPTPGFANLDPRPAGGPGGGKVAASQKGERVMNAPYTGALLKVGIGLSRHNGDWNSSPTALYNLRTAFLERCGLPEVEFKVNTIELSDLKGLLQNRTVLITSNNPIAFKPEELRAMREYMLTGGTLWVNDSSASESNTFDAAFRASIAGLLPGAELAPLPLEHPFFAACYDLRNGFKGYRVPPGDKYRVNYIEALVTADGRAPLIYTRNDYADGLEIDPRMSAGGKSLTDLTNAEMQEASLRFCLNLVSYSMQGSAPKMPPPPEGVAEFEKVYRYNGPELPKLDDFSVLQDQWQKPTWLAEKDWCNPTEMKIVEDAELKGKVVRVDFKGGAKFKAAVTRNLPVDFATTRALVADIHSSLGSGFNVALLFYTKDGRSYETRPVFVRPGLNRNVRFPLDMGDMKSSATNPPWKEYDQPFAPRNNVERVTLLFYNLGENGAVKIGAIREQK